ncbi:porin [Pseudomonas aeruginosa]
MKKMHFLALALAMASSSAAFALDQGDYKFNGFGTIGVSHLGGEDADYGINGQINDHWRGDAISKAGAQFQYGLTDKIDVTAQLTAKPERDKWKGNVEWLYVAGHVNDNLTVRAGRLRTPVYMYSETLDVGNSYPWLRLPDEVYSQVQLSNYEGADVTYSLPMGEHTLTLGANAGQAVNRNYYQYDMLLDADYKNYRGLSASFATSEFGTFRASFSEADISVNHRDEIHGRFVSYGYQFDNGTWLANAEKTQLVTEGPGNDLNAYYVMGGRRIGDFLVHLTHAEMHDQGVGTQSSMTYGLNYSLTPSITLKGEYKRVDTDNRYEGDFVKTPDELKDEYIYKLTHGGMGVAPSSYDGDVISVGVDYTF